MYNIGEIPSPSKEWDFTDQGILNSDYIEQPSQKGEKGN